MKNDQEFSPMSLASYPKKVLQTYPSKRGKGCSALHLLFLLRHNQNCPSTASGGAGSSSHMAAGNQVSRGRTPVGREGAREGRRVYEGGTRRLICTPWEVASCFSLSTWVTTRKAQSTLAPHIWSSIQVSSLALPVQTSPLQHLAQNKQSRDHHMSAASIFTMLIEKDGPKQKQHISTLGTPLRCNYVEERNWHWRRPKPSSRLSVHLAITNFQRVLLQL